MVQATEEPLQRDRLANVHVRRSRGAVNDNVQRVALPDQAHAEPEEAEAVFEFLAGGDGPDQAGDDETPQAAANM